MLSSQRALDEIREGKERERERERMPMARVWPLLGTEQKEKRERGRGREGEELGRREGEREGAEALAEEGREGRGTCTMWRERSERACARCGERERSGRRRGGRERMPTDLSCTKSATVAT